jgi:hypothetical protein
MIKFKYIHCLFTFCIVFSQNDISSINDIDDFQISSETFFTGNDGKIKMFVNVWGHVNNPGLHEVYDGIDMATLLSVVGGPRNGAKMSKVRLYRQLQDENKKISYIIDLENFFKTGSRNNFVKIKPNDTIIVPQTLSNNILSRLGAVNTFLTMFNIYYQIQRNN